MFGVCMGLIWMLVDSHVCVMAASFSAPIVRTAAINIPTAPLEPWCVKAHSKTTACERGSTQSTNSYPFEGAILSWTTSANCELLSPLLQQLVDVLIAVLERLLACHFYTDGHHDRSLRARKFRKQTMYDQVEMGVAMWPAQPFLVHICLCRNDEDRALTTNIVK